MIMRKGTWIGVWAVLALSVPAFADDLSKPIFNLDPSQYCAKDSTGKYVGAFQVKSGEETGADDAALTDELDSKYMWGQGGGCIFRATRDAWGALHNQPLMVWDGVSESTFTTVAPLPGATHRYQVQYIVRDIVTVKWKMDWHHSLQQGTLLAPQQVTVNYRKVEGTTYIPYWEGTVVLKDLAPGVVAFAMRNQVNAAQTSADDAASSVRDIFTKASTGAPNLGPLTPKP